MEITLSTEIGGRRLSIQTGKMARQAGGSVVVTYGETISLVTAVGSHDERNIDFVPLSVEYQEKIYAAGRIPGNYFRREIGRPSEKETLTARLIDRPIRPLLPKTWRYETQVIATVLSMDQENDPDTLSMIGASAALGLSDVSFAGPIASVRVGRINGEYVINPTLSALAESDMNVIIAGSRNGVVMVEGGGQFISEADMLEAIFLGQEAVVPILELQEELIEKAGVTKRAFSPPEKDEALSEKVGQMISADVENAMDIADKLQRQDRIHEIKTQVMENLGEDYADRKKEVTSLYHDHVRTIMRDRVLVTGKRIGDRAFDEVRGITAEVGVLPRTHGSALFTRGETQALGIMTLGSTGDEQRVETLSGEEYRPFMLHYNFPPYSVREVRRISGPSRRDIGHGGLSTRAIIPVLPAKEDFDYTIRIVSEILESNGSSSMATVCAASLSLMDGGVPITAPVSGIAMGLMQEGDKIVILSDILGDEDHMGDMDFKVAGTRDGITSVQMDIKIHGLSKQIMQDALEQARAGRLHILDVMIEALDKAREELSPYAPKVIVHKINPDKIRDIIGPGGKTIRAIQADTDTRLDVADDGTVKISAANDENAQQALSLVKEITAVPEIGTIYEGLVTRITDFGAFVQILPGTEGLCHISQIANEHVKRVSDHIKEGETIKVKVLDLTRDGKIRLSRSVLLKEGDGKGLDKNRSGKQPQDRK